MLLTHFDLAEVVVNKPVIDARTDPARPPTGVVDLATGTYQPITQIPPPAPFTTGQWVAIGLGVVGGLGLLMWLASRMPPAPVVYYEDDYDAPVVVRRRRRPTVVVDEPTVVVDEAPALLVNPRKQKKSKSKKR